MNKIFKVKRNSAGNAVACSEIAKSHTAGKVVATALVVTMVGLMVSGTASAKTAINPAGTIPDDERSKTAIVIGDKAVLHRLVNRSDKAIIIGYSAQAGSSDQNLSYFVDNNPTHQLIKKDTEAYGRGYNSSYLSSSIAIGENAASVGSAGIAIGNDAGASLDGVALGTAALSEGGVSLGRRSYSTSNSVAIGDLSLSKVKGGVALGYNSLSDRGRGVVGYLGSLPTSNDRKGWFSTDSAISIGNSETNHIRQLTNLAAGSEDTDAVNVLQLKAATNQIVEVLGATAAVANTGDVTMTNIGGTGKNNINDAISDLKTSIDNLPKESTKVKKGDGVTVASETKDNVTTYTVAVDESVIATKEYVKNHVATEISEIQQSVQESVDEKIGAGKKYVVDELAKKADKTDVDNKNKDQDSAIETAQSTADKALGLAESVSGEVETLQGKIANTATTADVTEQYQKLDGRINNMGDAIDQLDHKFDRLTKETRYGFAQQAALSGLFQPYTIGKGNASVALGGHGSNVAVAVGAGYRFDEKIAVKAGFATSTNGGGQKGTYNIGVNYEW